MSQNFFRNESGRLVLYGVDLPTGGFFYTEFYNDDEIGGYDDEVVVSESALTLSELSSKLDKKYSKTISLGEMVNQFKDSS